MSVDVGDGYIVDVASPHLPNLGRRHRGVLGLAYEDHRVDVRGVPLRPPEQLAVLREAIDQDIDLLPDERPREAAADLLLHGYELVAARGPRLGIDLVGELGRRGAVLLRVDKGAHPLEAEAPDKVHQVPVLLVCLAREAGDEGRAHGEPRDAAAQFVEEVLRVLPWRAVHREQHEVVDVLERHVDVLADLGVGGDLIDERLGEVGRVRVQNAYPAEALDGAEVPQQLGEAVPLPRVHPILVCVLGDEVQFLRAGVDQALRLPQDVGVALGAEAAAESGDRAEGARVVAALRDTQVRGVARGQAEAVKLRPEGHRRSAHLDSRALRILGGINSGVKAKRAPDGRRKPCVLLEANNQVCLRELVC
mmetsp:Transcript_21549/g.51418  ORF Transcript_21549/g.51418 Transcript_21549/m.51418 type:complete len:364 (+) Transcript_21549:465-1556(+)